MSQEKAQNLSQKFYDINKIFDVYILLMMLELDHLC